MCVFNQETPIFESKTSKMVCCKASIQIQKKNQKFMKPKQKYFFLGLFDFYQAKIGMILDIYMHLKNLNVANFELNVAQSPRRRSKGPQQT